MSAKIVPFFKGALSKDYSNVPDTLKWAIPVHEAITSKKNRDYMLQVEARVNQKIANEQKTKLKSTLKVVF